ncbi:hypothetical protein [Streptosporangium sp. NPDC003464]
MRRWLALAAATLIASVAAAVPAGAQTGPPDPAQAVKRQLRAETNELLADLTSPAYMTVVGGYLYASGLYSLPQGKTWARSAAPRPDAQYATEAATQQTAVNSSDRRGVFARQGGSTHS